MTTHTLRYAIFSYNMNSFTGNTLSVLQQHQCLFIFVKGVPVEYVERSCELNGCHKREVEYVDRIYEHNGCAMSSGAIAFGLSMIIRI